MCDTLEESLEGAVLYHLSQLVKLSIEHSGGSARTALDGMQQVVHKIVPESPSTFRNYNQASDFFPVCKKCRGKLWN